MRAWICVRNVDENVERKRRALNVERDLKSANELIAACERRLKLCLPRLDLCDSLNTYDALDFLVKIEANRVGRVAVDFERQHAQWLFAARMAFEDALRNRFFKCRRRFCKANDFNSRILAFCSPSRSNALPSSTRSATRRRAVRTKLTNFSN